jgi:hypothetical protein
MAILRFVMAATTHAASGRGHHSKGEAALGRRSDKKFFLINVIDRNINKCGPRLEPGARAGSSPEDSRA